MTIPVITIHVLATTLTLLGHYGKHLSRLTVDILRNITINAALEANKKYYARRLTFAFTLVTVSNDHKVNLYSLIAIDGTQHYSSIL